MSFDQGRTRMADGIEKGGDKLGEAIRPSSYSSTRGYGQEVKQDLREGAEDVRDAARDTKNAIKATPPPPAYSDIAKAANDLLNKDFYHVAAANLEVKSKTPTGLAYTVKGKSAHDKPPTASLEGKKTIPDTGMTGTVTWSTFNQIDAKLEADENIAKGLKVEGIGSFKPDSQDMGTKLNFYFKQPALNFRVMSDLLKGPTLNADVVLGHQGFLVGGEAGYDVQKAAVTRYSASVGYTQGNHTTALTATNNFSIFAASFYNKVNSQVEIGTNAAWDSKSSTTVGMELAAKYKVDPSSFFKAKINDRAIAALAYNTKINDNVSFGVGTSFDTQKLNEGTHKVGCHLAFEG